jgi:lipid II:glycine glycyltransferase (peptidoglycan interpeptide bridge formation enzyme)
MLLHSMKPKGRYNIHLGDRHGVKVSETADPGAVEKFYPVLEEASRRDGFALEPFMFFHHLAQALCPTGYARFLFAEHDGDLLGALLLVMCGNRATYLYGGISNTKRNLMGGYALQWATMLSAKRAGCCLYDFYGFDSCRAPQHDYARFSQFKSQFGGSAVRLIGAQEHFFVDCLADVFIKVVNQAL